MKTSMESVCPRRLLYWFGIRFRNLHEIRYPEQYAIELTSVCTSISPNENLASWAIKIYFNHIQREISDLSDKRTPRDEVESPYVLIRMANFDLRSVWGYYALSYFTTVVLITVGRLQTSQKLLQSFSSPVDIFLSIAGYFSSPDNASIHDTASSW